MTESSPEEEATLVVTLFLSRQEAGPEENQLSCLFCHKGHGVEWETSYRPEGTGKRITAGVCERCRTLLKPAVSTIDTDDDSASVYYRALEELTCLIEPAEGAEDCLSPEKALRNAIILLSVLHEATPIKTDTIACLKVLEERFFQLRDREDLDL